jgi:predicted DNA-binding protein (UPF0251 family)
MKVESKKAIKCQVELNVSFDAAEVSEIVKKVERDFVSHAELPGFRKGKAPLDLIRKNSRMDEIDTVILDSDGEFEIDIADDSPDSRPDASYLRKVEKETVLQSIEELPSAAREIIVLRDIEGLSYAEIGAMLGIAEGTLKSKLFRARERLRKIILSKNIF